MVGWREQISRPEGYIFLSPPGSVTPAHVDHEHNFLLQVEGTKTMTIGFLDPDREERLLESMYDGHYGRTDALPDECESFVLEPGTGVYVPPIGPPGREPQQRLDLVLARLPRPEPRP